MHVLLIDVLESTRPRLVLKVPVFDRDMERVLIELYYRGVAEGLVHSVIEDIVEGDFLDVIELSDWVNSKLLVSVGVKERSLLSSLSDKLVLV